MINWKALGAIFGLFTLVCSTPLWAQGPYEVSLYTGITGLVHLGESYAQVTKNIQSPLTKIEIDPNSELGKLKFTESIVYRDIGLKLYFRRSGVVMIMMQEPFKGTIRTKKIDLFSFSVPPVSDWEALLVRELGQPEFKASGGRLSSQGLYYSWGDISFNRMGANELALYRDSEISKFRQNHFGRDLELFPSK